MSKDTKTADVLPVVKTWLNFHLFPKNQAEKSQAKQSLTIPDQSLTVKQMLERHSRGLPIMGTSQTPLYEGEEMEFPDLKKMDLSEIQDMREFISEKIKNAQEQAVKNKTNREQRERAEFEEWKKRPKENQSGEDQKPADQQKPNSKTTSPK